MASNGCLGTRSLVTWTPQSFFTPVLAPSLAFSLCLAPPALPLILSEMVCASRNLHNTLLTPLL